MQIIHVSEVDMDIELKVRRSEITWQTRALAMFIANTVQDEKGRDQLLGAVEKLDLVNADTSDEETVDDGTWTQEQVMKLAMERNAKRRGPSVESLVNTKGFRENGSIPQ